MAKVIEVHFGCDKSIWYIPVEAAARERALRIAKASLMIDGVIINTEEFGTIYKDELKVGLNNSYELLKWISSNLKWNDLKAYASIAVAPEEGHEEEWSSAYKEVKSLNSWNMPS